MATYIGAIDQGTTSSRFIVFDKTGRIVSVAQKEHEQIFPKPGWVEHDPLEIWRRVEEVVTEAMESKGLKPSDLAAIGITNPSIEDLLTKADSKYALVIYSAKRARQINAYYSQLQEGLLEYVGPLVEAQPHEKPLSIALREINEDLLTSTPEG